jgi:hypothetical protein
MYMYIYLIFHLYYSIANYSSLTRSKDAYGRQITTIILVILKHYERYQRCQHDVTVI